jgi:hypothetical protein
MPSKEDRETHQSNLMYFNQMIEEKGIKKSYNNKKTAKKVSSSFGSQKVELSDYLLAPDGYEAVVYPLYFAFVPYLTGALLLFIFVAGGDFNNFKLIEFNSFIVVWLMGYEVVATVVLLAILVAFLKYEDDLTENNRHF